MSTTPHEHRLRLRRSTRKLEALLGETPLVVDTYGPASTILAGPRSSSRPTLILSLLPSPEETPAPLSPTFSLALSSPTTPTLQPSRRRKMAKLARTLGENVPPELVFGTKTTSQQHRRRASTMSHPALDVRRGSYSSHSSAGGSSETLASWASAESEHVHLLPLRRSSPSPQPLPRMHRAERGWSGEWGGQVGNMDDVVRGLRRLKVQ